MEAIALTVVKDFPLLVKPILLHFTQNSAINGIPQKIRRDQSRTFQTALLVHGGYVRKVIVSGLQFVKWFTGGIATSARKNVLLLTKHKNSLVSEMEQGSLTVKLGVKLTKVPIFRMWVYMIFSGSN